MNKEWSVSSNVPPQVQLCIKNKQKHGSFMHQPCTAQEKRITLYAPKSMSRAGTKSTTNKCMCCDATSLLNRFKDSFPLCNMPEKLTWYWPCFIVAKGLPTMMPRSTPRDEMRGHQTLRLCCLLAFLIWLSSCRITPRTDLK